MKYRPIMIPLGALAGALSYGIVAHLHSPWSEVIAPLFIGVVPGIADGCLRGALISSGACVGGWLVGSFLFGVWIDAGIGVWLFAGGFFGLIADYYSSLWTRAVAGLILGLLGGAFAEFSRYATVLLEPLRGADMQFLLLVCAGTILSSIWVLVAAPAPKRRS
jgi:hypothetical protein